MDHPVPEILPMPLLRAGVWKSVGEAHEHALVLLAMGLDCSVHPADDGYEILTDATDIGAARHELALYEREQAERPVRRDLEMPEYPAGTIWMVVWAILLGATYLHQMRSFDFTDRLSNSSIGLFDDGEWWRPFTALFLHADPMHLFGNIAIGGLFCYWVSKSVGAWKAWPLILLGGTIGNAINAAMHYPEPFTSIGASSANFAALGILAGLAVIEAVKSRSYERFRSLAVPFVAALILFGMFGISGERTDIGGHAWGGLCGLALGLVTPYVFSNWTADFAPQRRIQS